MRPQQMTDASKVPVFSVVELVVGSDSECLRQAGSFVT